MCQSDIRGFLAALPKCEHHMHLEGSLSPELLFSLAAKNSIALPSSDLAFTSVEALYARYAAFTSLDDFLAYYYIGFTVLCTESDFEDLAYAYFEKAHATNVRHAEVFFDPQVHLDRGIALSAVVNGFSSARRRAEKDFGLTSMLIPCLLRHLPVPNSRSCFDSIVAAGYWADGTLGGLGLCSTEIGKPPSAWADVFADAKALGIRRTVHAAEEGPAAYVTAALDDLSAMRIDHGVRAAQDPAVLERLAREEVLLSVCPLSNVCLKGVEKIEDVPIRKLLDAGVRFSINSDDPAYFGGYIQENYFAVQDAFGLTVDEWTGIAKNSVIGSWCEQKRKDQILSEIDAVVADWMAKAA